MKLISFLKKYPMSILLAIIAINLFSISNTLKENGNTLRENGKLDRDKQICAARNAYYSRRSTTVSSKEGIEFDSFNIEKLALNKGKKWIIGISDYCAQLRDENF